MYPDHPDSPSDLVPLPRCDGPKLESFDFKGPQSIQFLEYLGRGLHSHVIKVKIRGKLYALKLVRRKFWKRNLSPTLIYSRIQSVVGLSNAERSAVLIHTEHLGSYL